MALTPLSKFAFDRAPSSHAERSEMLKSAGARRTTFFDGSHIQNVARHDAKAATAMQGPQLRCSIGKPAPSSCGKSSIVLPTWRPRSGPRLPLGPIDLALGICDQPAPWPVVSRRRRFSVWKLASASVRPRFRREANLGRPKRAGCQQATARSSHFRKHSSQQARMPRTERQRICISRS
jgi:hypothetical protein